MLTNPSFSTSAPANVVAEKQAKLDEVKQKIMKIKIEIAKMKME